VRRGDAFPFVEPTPTDPSLHVCRLIDERSFLVGNTGLRTALHYGLGHEDVVRLLLARGADPNIRDEGDNAFPLHFVAENENLAIMRLLIEHGADPIGTGDGHELEVIGWATVFGSAKPEIVDYLLAHGARHNIYSAVATGNVAAIRANAADVDRPMDRTNHRRRPLHLAVVKQQPDALAALLALGADPNAVDAAGLTPLDQAALNGESRMVADLLAHGATLSLPAAVVLHRDVERVLAEHPGVLKPGAQWGALILRAAEQAPGSVIETLIGHGASVHVVDSDETAVDSTRGYTPLHAAAFRGNIDAARVLLEHGASVTARDSKYHATPAGWAEYAGRPDVRDLILAGPIDMFDAIAFDRPDRLREIFDRNAGVLNEPMRNRLSREPRRDERMKSWWNPLAFAVVHGKTDAVRALLDLGARATIRDPDGKTLIEIAAALGNAEIGRLLTEHAERAEALA
jgi:ankyrin repeat protein